MLAAISIINALIALAGEVPELVTAGQTVVKLITENRDPTPEEQAQFDAALTAAQASLQQD